MKEIKHIEIREDMKVSELVGEMKEAGFGARKIGEASDILRKMLDDRECKVFLGVAGAMVPGGMKKVIIDMLKSKSIDVFVTTGANLTHDLIEALGESHYSGDELGDDKKLNEKGIDRMYNVYMKNEVYANMENFFKSNFFGLENCENIKDFLWKIGEKINSEDSILRVCYKNKIPIFCPGIADSGIGLMVWGRLMEGKKIKVGVFDDMKDIIDISWQAKKSGVIYIGGGLPKNFIQQSLQFSKGADYGIQITTDRPESGGSSGAPLKEGISWGKLKPDAKFVDVFCDATIALPLIWAGFKG